MRIIMASTMTLAALLAGMTAASANNCRALKAQHGEDKVWECRAAFESDINSITPRGVSRDECFLSAREGFAWVERQTGEATGRIEVEDCSNQGKTMSYREFINSQ